MELTCKSTPGELMQESADTRAVKRHGGTLAGREKRLLNLGCGRTFHPAWFNVDFRECTSTDRFSTQKYYKISMLSGCFSTPRHSSEKLVILGCYHDYTYL
jgi:hypothetical protein